MTILHVLEPFATGVTTAVSSICRELPDFTHIVIHGSRNWTESTEKVKLRFPPAVTFVEWKSAAREISLKGDWKALWELVAILKKYKPLSSKTENSIVVHLHSSKAGFLGRVACRFLGIKPVIYTPHCGPFLRTDISAFKRKMYYFFEWTGSLFGGRVVGCGPSEGEIYKKLGKNTTYVSNGIALREAAGNVIDAAGSEAGGNAGGEACNNTGVDKAVDTGAGASAKAGRKSTSSAAGSRNLVGFLGLATFQKDPALWSEIACSSAAFAREKGFSFCWIGDGPQAASLDRNCLLLTGWKSAGEAEELLGKTAVFLSSAAWEGLPYGVLEAMASGCALLLRDVPGNRDLVLPGENGRLFKTKEEAVKQLKEMLEDRAALTVMGKRSREIIENGFTLEQMGEGYRKIYLECYRGKR